MKGLQSTAVGKHNKVALFTTHCRGVSVSASTMYMYFFGSGVQYKPEVAVEFKRVKRLLYYKFTARGTCRDFGKTITNQKKVKKFDNFQVVLQQPRSSPSGCQTPQCDDDATLNQPPFFAKAATFGSR